MTQKGEYGFYLLDNHQVITFVWAHKQNLKNITIKSFMTGSQVTAWSPGRMCCTMMGEKWSTHT